MADDNSERDSKSRHRTRGVTEENLFQLFILVIVLEVVGVLLSIVNGQLFSTYGVGTIILVPFTLYMLFRVRRRRREPLKLSPESSI